MKITVLIPTWKRASLLKLALESIEKQSRKADEVVVVYQSVDKEAIEVIQSFKTRLPLQDVLVKEPGVIYAENAGLSVIREGIVAFLDDDAEAPKDWLKIIDEHFFKDPNVGGVGGPDFIVRHHDPNYRKMVNVVGKILYYGKILGNHHHLTEKVMEVEVLKGVNMAFRRDLLELLDVNLQSKHNEGNGSHWELDLCFHVRSHGAKLIFDPSLDVQHHSDHSHFIHDINLRNNSRNLTYVLLKNISGPQRFVVLFYLIIIGNSQVFGILKYCQSFLKQGPKVATLDYINSLKGFFMGLKLWLKH